MEARLRTQTEAGGKEPTCAHRQDQGLLFVGLSSGEDPPHTTLQQHLRMVWALLTAQFHGLWASLHPPKPDVEMVTVQSARG